MQTETSDIAISIGETRVTYRNAPLVLPPQQMCVLREAYLEGATLEHYIQFTEFERSSCLAHKKSTAHADRQLRQLQSLVRIRMCGGEVRYNAATNQAYLRIATVERAAPAPDQVAAQAD